MIQEQKAKEQLSPLLKTAVFISLAISVLFLIIFLITNDPLWKGIFRLLAFIAFIGVVFSYLRLRQGQKQIQMELIDGQLLITYFEKSEMVKEELFERKTIKDIYKKEYKHSRFPFMAKGYEFVITFTDTKTILPLFEYSGRHLHFSETETKKIDGFIHELM